ncbi:site-specific integrase [Fructilactobacillus cliffordii]|uniref:Site-specific integrase n=1 Tax=Fructilactobacillus cliffordii TaxID=2940299 RepID=A0A9Q8ZSZ9_9LACO|nr:site-specific integrase [Fructilactobacillus cliffordii]USS86142.1 site-specific integrase [Fructilactobacillus cliffordii]USS89218.1 site-specific integrase [Fructilactobacillus cliffordii]
MRRKQQQQLLYEYFSEWIDLYKRDAVRDVTLNKYKVSLKWVRRIAPTLYLKDLSKRTYQEIINEYAITHEHQTTLDFHHQIKGAILDAVDEGLIPTNPTRNAVVKGKVPRNKKPKFLNEAELKKLIHQLDLGNEINWDWFLLLIIKTGLRFSEALAVTPDDFDFKDQMLRINKTWDYKSLHGGFQKTKNESSIRSIRIDWRLAMQFSQLITVIPKDQPIFISDKRVFNSTVNQHLRMLCKKADIPIITIHGLRHTHASLLLFGNVSIATVAQRLGHSSITTTQETYIHIIRELEAKDGERIMDEMAKLV